MTSCTHISCSCNVYFKRFNTLDQIDSWKSTREQEREREKVKVCVYVRYIASFAIYLCCRRRRSGALVTVAPVLDFEYTVFCVCERARVFYNHPFVALIFSISITRSLYLTVSADNALKFGIVSIEG